MPEEKKDGGVPHIASGAEIESVLERIAMARVGPTTRMQCKVCWHIYDPAEGCPEWNVEPGTPFNELPDDFCCPDCGQPKSAFIPADDDIG